MRDDPDERRNVAALTPDRCMSTSARCGTGAPRRSRRFAPRPWDADPPTDAGPPAGFTVTLTCAFDQQHWKRRRRAGVVVALDGAECSRRSAERGVGHGLAVASRSIVGLLLSNFHVARSAELRPRHAIGGGGVNPRAPRRARAQRSRRWRRSPQPAPRGPRPAPALLRDVDLRALVRRSHGQRQRPRRQWRCTSRRSPAAVR